MIDAILLSRWQFAVNIGFHILFPTITIALAWTLLYFRLRWLYSGPKPAVQTAGGLPILGPWRPVESRDNGWLMAYRFWTKVFALTFAVGVVSGVVMSFQFGTNWSGYMNRIGNIAGPLLGYEVLTAFFLEAGFLGIMLFGHGRVGERLHLLATLLVAGGTALSAFWILALNSWMQTPVGHEIIDGTFFVRSWWEVIFNPSFPYRLVHMLLASGITVAFVLAGVSAWQLLAGKANLSTSKALRTGLTVGALLVPLQIVVGDLHGLNTLEHQPQKVAAMEAIWETERGAPLLLFAWPNQKERRNEFAIGVPYGSSLILTHSLDGEIKGLNDYPDAHPPVAVVFFAFRVMVGLGMLMLAFSWVGLWLLRRRGWKAERLPRWLLWGLAAMSFSGWLATLAGWTVTEVGRQPFMVYGLLRTADLVSDITTAQVATSLTMYGLLYLVLLVSYVLVVRYMAGKPVDISPAPRLVPTGATP